MEYITIGGVAFLASFLTLFSGFGLGSLLLPAFLLFFPVELSVTLTAVVHLFNNLFKLVFFRKYVDQSIVLMFGLPALLAAFFGAKALFWLSGVETLVRYEWFGTSYQVSLIKLVIAVLIVLFVIFELLSSFRNVTFPRTLLPLGGLLSGFFGGISGHQGALRGAFLIKCGLTKEAFIGTGVVIACLIDFARLTVYGGHLKEMVREGVFGALVVALCFAFLGVFVGRQFLRKITMRVVQWIVSFLLLGIALGLASGHL